MTTTTPTDWPAVDYLLTDTVEHGGGTYVVTGGPLTADARTYRRLDLPQGYTVGIHPADYMKVHATDSWLMQTVLDSLSLNYPGALVGTWYDEATGFITVDPVVVVADEDTARKVGEALRQVAIWDNAANRIIFLK